MRAKAPKTYARLSIVVLPVIFAGCATSEQRTFQPPPLTPAPVGSVSSSSLPPLNSLPQEGQIASLDDGTGVPVDGLLEQRQDLQAVPNAAQNTGVVSQQEVTVGPNIEFGQNALLGAWNVSSQADTCAMNLSLTTWTGGFRASTRKCTSAGLQSIGAWQLAGKQLTLLDTQGGTLARLFASGPNRFDGTTETGSNAISVFR